MSFDILESKTKIRRDVGTLDIYKVIEDYIKKFKGEDFIFPSNQNDSNGNKKHLSYMQVYRVFKEIFGIVRIRGAKGTHIFRKTYANNILKKDIRGLKAVQEALGHKYIGTTILYIE